MHGVLDQEFTADVVLRRTDLGNMLFMGLRLIYHILLVFTSSFVLKSSYVGNVRDNRRKRMGRVSRSHWQVVFSINKHATFLHDTIRPLGS